MKIELNIAESKDLAIVTVLAGYGEDKFTEYELASVLESLATDLKSEYKAKQLNLENIADGNETVTETSSET